ncbi:hypothetical protein CFP56_028234, partial [Quercus suber]
CQRNPGFGIGLKRIRQGCLGVYHRLDIEEVHHSHRFDNCHAQTHRNCTKCEPKCGHQLCQHTSRGQDSFGLSCLPPPGMATA